MSSAADAVAEAHRSDWARIVAGLIRMTGDWALAEDAAGDAFATALVRWEADGTPPNPAAWLALTARNRAIDLLRRAANERTKLAVAALGDDAAAGEDDRLRLVFTCCHPALDLPAQVALTLRTVAGLEVADIARAFLVSEPTMAQRLVRARRKITNAGIPYQVPPPELLEPRLTGVLAVIYLAFNQGYSTAADTALASTAIDLARQLVELMPTESEARGLLALLMLQHSRRDARLGPAGELLTIEEQDRRRWRRSEIARAGHELASRPRAGSLRAAGGHRRGPRDRADRGEHAVGPGRGPLRRAARARAVARRGAEPRHRGRDARRTGRRPRPPRRAGSTAADVLVAAGGAGRSPRPGGPAGGRGAPLPGRRRAHGRAGGARRARAAAGAGHWRSERSPC